MAEQNDPTESKMIQKRHYGLGLGQKSFNKIIEIDPTQPKSQIVSYQKTNKWP